MENLRWHYAQLCKVLGNMRVYQWLKPFDSFRLTSHREQPATSPFCGSDDPGRLGEKKLVVSPTEI